MPFIKCRECGHRGHKKRDCPRNPDRYTRDSEAVSDYHHNRFRQRDDPRRDDDRYGAPAPRNHTVQDRGRDSSRNRMPPPDRRGRHRSRSRSPHREDNEETDGNTNRRELFDDRRELFDNRHELLDNRRELLDNRPSRWYPGKNNDFADPFFFSNTQSGLDRQRRGEMRSIAADAEGAEVRGDITNLLERFKSKKLLPADVPGQYITGLLPHPTDTEALEDLRRVATNWNIVGAQLYGLLHRAEYGDFDSQNQKKANDAQKLGTMGRASILEGLYDRGVGVNDLDRFHSQHGPGIGDRRPVILLERKYRKLKVASMTGFHGANGVGRGKPPRGEESIYARLLPDFDQTTPVRDDEVVVRYSGDALAGDLWVRLSRIHELPEDANVEWSKGAIEIQSHQDLADAFNFPDDHDLRIEGREREEEQKAKITESGNDAETIRQRGIRMAQQTTELEAENERKEAAKQEWVRQKRSELDTDLAKQQKEKDEGG